VQNQKILSAYAYSDIGTQYGNITINVTPKEKQTLEEAKELVLHFGKHAAASCSTLYAS
jgi:hypothetical protein